MRIRYISLFSGIGAGELAFERVFGDDAQCVGYSEIDDDALKVYREHFDHPFLGDVTGIDGRALRGRVDLIIGGSPCQGFSSVGSRKNLDDVRSKLLFQYIRLVKEIRPRWFILENVRSMSKDIRDLISSELGVEPVLIDSSSFGAQIRNRFYWTNFPVVVSSTCSTVVLSDVLVRDSKLKTCTSLKKTDLSQYIKKGTRPFAFTYFRPKDAEDTSFASARVRPRTDGKSNPVCAVINDLQTIFDGKRVRKLEVVEAERLQGFPDGWVGDHLPRCRGYRCVGNAFTVPVIAHILECLREHVLSVPKRGKHA